MFYSLLATNYLLFFFLLGLCVGSFLNVVINRLNAGESFLSGRSHCPNCKTDLKWFELVPLLSFVFLAGKCRTCGAKISWQYPSVELATGLLFMGAAYFILPSGFSFENLDYFAALKLAYWLVLVSLFVVMFVYDLKHYIIPNQTVYPAISLALAFSIFETIWRGGRLFALHSPSGGGLFSAFLAAGFFFSLIVISRGEWMGMGDVKLALAMGFFLGWPAILPALAFAFFSGSIVGLLLVFLQKKGFQSQIPFGPFLILGTLFAAVWGEKVINWYLGGFL